MTREQLSLTTLARAGFVGLSSVRGELDELVELTGFGVDDLLPALSAAADPDTALALALRLLRHAPVQTARYVPSRNDARRVFRVIGASTAPTDSSRSARNSSAVGRTVIG